MTWKLLERPNAMSSKANDSFLVEKIAYLGYIFSKDGITVDHQR